MWLVKQSPKLGLFGVSHHVDRDYRGLVSVWTVYFGWRQWRYWGWIK